MPCVPGGSAGRTLHTFLMRGARFPLQIFLTGHKVRQLSPLRAAGKDGIEKQPQHVANVAVGQRFGIQKVLKQ